MAEVTTIQEVNANLSNVWASWSDFGNIDQFHPSLKNSHLIQGSAETGLGATRQCNFSDGKNYIREKIIGYVPEKQLVFDIYEGTMPLKKAIGTLDFEAVGHNRTKVTMQVVFTPKMGLFGQLLVPIMKKKFRSDLGKLLSANATYIEQNSNRAAA